MITSFEKTLGELFISRHGLEGHTRGQVRNDSRKVLPGDIFVAIPGAVYDGHDFITKAAAAGAQVIVHERELTDYLEKPTYIRVTDSSRAYARLVREFCDCPDEYVKLIGVTGTNGKTTTAFLVEHIFRNAGEPCGLVSTVEYRDGKITAPATHTTPEAGILFPLLATMRRNGMRAAAMELSSHALQQGRINGARFRTAIFTNLTGDHLDYHGDMEHYYQAKKLFFTRLLGLDGTAVINIDDEFGKRLARDISGRQQVTFGMTPAADWVISDVELGAEGSKFRLTGEEQAFDVATNLIGTHNIHNLTGAILAALDYGLKPEAISHALNRPIRVPGRLEPFRASPEGPVFYVDYAHTDDALKNVLEILRRITKGKLIAVFGAGGDRDRSKRPRMGKAAAQYADHLILTSDNPRSEEPQKIIDEIAAGIPAGTSFETEPDRAQALRRAVAVARPGDVVLIAGKGHENYQEIQGVRRSLDDRKLIKTLISDPARK